MLVHADPTGTRSDDRGGCQKCRLALRQCCFRFFINFAAADAWIETHGVGRGVFGIGPVSSAAFVEDRFGCSVWSAELPLKELIERHAINQSNSFA